ncbi:Eukaryotic translation initiation factor 3 subunit 7 (eIF-3) [Trifolium repens]|nr:Eukaryotic translation initiation factor 3 subunit 7 (eIF-3) [Trifolium repens]
MVERSLCMREVLLGPDTGLVSNSTDQPNFHNLGLDNGRWRNHAVPGPTNLGGPDCRLTIPEDKYIVHSISTINWATSSIKTGLEKIVRWQSGPHKLVEPGLLHPASNDDDNTFRLVDVLIRDGNKVTFDEANPFANDIYLGARCEVHSIVELNKQSSFLIVNALNEFDSKYSCVDWRQKLEIPRGVVFAGADMMKLVGIRTSLVKLKIVNSTQTKTATLLR